MAHLERVRAKYTAETESGFPFSVPVIRDLVEIEFGPAVTFFVGENGSGKSTLLEAIGLAAGLPVVGTDEGFRDPSFEHQRRLAGRLGLVWQRRTRRGFFLRAEDFFGWQRRLARERAELKARMDEIDREYRAQDRSDHALALAKGPMASSLGDMERRYGRDPDARSHGEAFLALFRDRFVPGSLVLLDEPEAALSPQSQLGLLAMLMEMAGQDAQFVIATHSPIILGYPGATILSFDGGRIERAQYDDLDHVRLTRDYLADPARFLRRLQG
jgi:predicted ATPase